MSKPISDEDEIAAMRQEYAPYPTSAYQEADNAIEKARAAAEAQNTAKTPHEIADAPGMDTKRFATLRARAALAGVELHRSTDDHDRPLYCAVKWAMVRHLSSLDEVAAWLAQVDGRTE